MYRHTSVNPNTIHPHSPCAPKSIPLRVEQPTDSSRGTPRAPERKAAASKTVGWSADMAQSPRPLIQRHTVSIRTSANGVVGRSIHRNRREICCQRQGDNKGKKIRLDSGHSSSSSSIETTTMQEVGTQGCQRELATGSPRVALGHGEGEREKNKCVHILVAPLSTTTRHDTTRHNTTRICHLRLHSSWWCPRPHPMDFAVSRDKSTVDVHSFIHSSSRRRGSSSSSIASFESPRIQSTGNKKKRG